ncbi:MAG: right-handed parallel beta-helix repeat-containing protein, partial [Promethearchaeota archaeon]
MILSLIIIVSSAGTRIQYQESFQKEVIDENNVHSYDILNEVQDNFPRSTQDWVVSSILIDDLSILGLNWSDTETNEAWCSGAGTIGDPYVIENVTIDANGKGYGISISHSVKHFILRNCVIQNGEYYDEAILLYNVSNGIIESNRLVDNIRGIMASYLCDNNTVRLNNITGQTLSSGDWGISFNNNCDNNTIFDNWLDYVDFGVRITSTSQHTNISSNLIESLSDDGIYVSGSCHYTHIELNTLLTGGATGINLISSDYCTVIDNTITDMYECGIYLYSGADHANISSNTLSGNEIFGIMIQDVTNATLQNNLMTGNCLGFYTSNPIIADYNHTIDTSNLVDGNPIYYYQNEKDLTSANFTNAAQIYLVDCSDSEITGMTIVDKDYGVFLAECDNITVQANHFENNALDGIYAFNTINSNFTRNNCTQNKRRGIFFDHYCDFNEISLNNVTHNGDGVSYINSFNFGADYGIYIYYFSDDVVIQGNFINDTYSRGISIYDRCHNIQILSNQIHESTQYGIYVSSTCDNSTITYNNVSTTQYGLYISSYCDIALIHKNNVSDIDYYGIYITNYCYDFNITANIVKDCGLSGEYAGIYLSSFVDRVRIIGNNISNCDRYGLYFSSLQEAVVEDNRFFGTGFYITRANAQYYRHYFNLNNTLDGKTIYYYYNERDLLAPSFSNAAQIYMINCIGGIIENPEIHYTQYGLFLYNTTNVVLTNGNFSYNHEYSIYLYQSSDNQMLQTNSSNVEDYSLAYLGTACNNNTFEDCYLHTTRSAYQYGIELVTDCVNNTFINNIVDYAGYGISLTTRCNSNNFTGNIINRTRYYYGINIYGNCDNNSFYNNIVEKSSIYAVYIYSSCIGNAFTSNQIHETIGQYDIYIYSNCNNNSFIANNITDNTGHGFYIRTNSHYTQIIGNNISNNGQSGSYGYGIYLYNLCSYTNITGNLIIDNGETGIYMNDECESTTIHNNSIRGNYDHGIFAQDQCRYVDIVDNTISLNGIHGVYIFNDCDDFLVEKNTISNNSDHGLYIEQNCNSNYVFNNTIANNTVMGMAFYDSANDNDIFLNWFLNNTQHALDNGLVNRWDNGSIGNYWDNYTESDLDDNGIGDVVWIIVGTGNQVDHYPIWEDGTDLDPFPDISSPEDIHYYFGNVGHNISWVANASSPDYYIITRNGTIITEGVWFNWVSIAINVDTLEVGIYLYICMVNSTYDNTEIYDDVIVTVERTSPLINKLDDFNFTVGQAGFNLTWIGDSPVSQTVIISQDGVPIFQDTWSHLVPIVYMIPILFPGIYIFDCWLNTTTNETVTDQVKLQV